MGANLENQVDVDALAAELEQLAEVRRSWQEQAAAWLRRFLPAPTGRSPRRVLDVGSGPGVTTCLLAEALPDVEVVAVDVQNPLLDRVARRAARLRLTERVQTLRADLGDPGVPLPDADLIWAASVVHHLGDQRAVLRRLAAALRPGGVLAVAEGGLPGRFLPRDTRLGRPGLQARLDALMENWFTERRAQLVGAVRVAEDWPGLLAGAGLAPLGSRTFLVDLPAPLPSDARHHVHAMLARQRDLLGDRIDPDDRSQLAQLLDPRSPHGVLRRPDVFLLAASTVHAGRAIRGRPRPAIPAPRRRPPGRCTPPPPPVAPAR